jgi:hypothetical protein
MKVAVAITGLPRKVEEGYDKFWKNLIDKWNADVYLQFWEDEEYDKVLNVYKSPTKYVCEKPFKFTKHQEGVVSPNDDKSRPIPAYDVWGNFRSLPMFHCWQTVCSLMENKYDCVIRGRYDLSGFCNIENLDLNKVNVAGAPWPGTHILDDNLFVSNYEIFYDIHNDAIDNLVEHCKKVGQISFAEKNMTDMIYRKGYSQMWNKSKEINHEVLRENKLWY